MERFSEPEELDSPIAIALMLAQYRMSKLEEIVTNNVFRVIWFTFVVYVSSTAIDISSIRSSQTISPVFLIFEPFGLFLAAIILYVVSGGFKSYIGRQSDIFRDLLISSDYYMKDFYVRELYKEEMRKEHSVSHPFKLLSRHEQALWFLAAILILGVRMTWITLVH